MNTRIRDWDWLNRLTREQRYACRLGDFDVIRIPIACTNKERADGDDRGCREVVGVSVGVK